jgi:valyl-tRNA synthetase
MEDPEICPKCKSPELEQDADVLDTWFSSWLWPFSTLGWPEDTAEMRYFYPTDVLVSAYDIIFFWIARMIMAGLEFTGEIPYHTVYITGMIKDELGRWMSKSLGNGIDPMDMIEQYGADAVRYSLVVLNTEGQDIRLAPTRFEMGRNFANKLWNAGRFLHIQGKLSGCELGEEDLADRWIKSRLNSAIEAVHKETQRFRLDDALGAIYKFTWNEYCDWYLELLKPRLYGKSPQDRERALSNALTIFKDILKLLHPYMPFITEELNQALFESSKGEGLLIKGQYPEIYPEFIYAEAEVQMAFVQEVISAIRNLRAEMNVPPMKMAELAVIEKNEHIELLEKQVQYLTTLARIDRIKYYPEKPRPATSAIVGGLELFLPLGDLIDVQAELKRLTKEKERLIGKIEGINKKLSNAQFLQKADSGVIEREREKLSATQSELIKLSENIQAISG